MVFGNKMSNSSNYNYFIGIGFSISDAKDSRRYLIGYVQNNTGNDFQIKITSAREFYTSREISLSTVRKHNILALPNVKMVRDVLKRVRRKHGKTVLEDTMDYYIVNHSNRAGLSLQEYKCASKRFYTFIGTIKQTVKKK